MSQIYQKDWSLKPIVRYYCSHVLYCVVLCATVCLLPIVYYICVVDCYVHVCSLGSVPPSLSVTPLSHHGLDLPVIRDR